MCVKQILSGRSAEVAATAAPYVLWAASPGEETLPAGCRHCVLCASRAVGSAQDTVGALQCLRRKAIYLSLVCVTRVGPLCLGGLDVPAILSGPQTWGPTCPVSSNSVRSGLKLDWDQLAHVPSHLDVCRGGWWAGASWPAACSELWAVNSYWNHQLLPSDILGLSICLLIK